MFEDIPVQTNEDVLRSFETRVTPLGEYFGAKVSEGFDYTTSRVVADEFRISAAEEKAYGKDNRPTVDPGELMFADPEGYDRLTKTNRPIVSKDDWEKSENFRPGIKYEKVGEMTPVRAQILAEDYDNRRYRDSLLERSPTGLRSILGFGAGMIGSLLDPVNLISFGGVAAGRTLGKAALIGAAENVAASALVDAVVLPDLAAKGEDVGFKEFAMDSMFAAAIGGLFGVGGQALKNATEAARMRTHMQDRQVLANSLEKAAVDVADGRPADVRDVLQLSPDAHVRLYDAEMAKTFGVRDQGTPAPVKSLPEAVQDLFTGKEPAEWRGEPQTITLLGGMSGAGKSSATDTPAFAEMKRRSVAIDPDGLKEATGKLDPQHHEEHSLAAKDAMRVAIDGGYDVLYDSTLSNHPKAAKAIEDVVSRGGRANVVFVDTHPDASIPRILKREELTGRPVPASAIADSHNRGLPTFLELYRKYQADPRVNFTLYDNNGASGHKVFEQVNGVFQIYDQKILDNVLDTAYIGIDGGHYERTNQGQRLDESHAAGLIEAARNEPPVRSVREGSGRSGQDSQGRDAAASGVQPPLEPPSTATPDAREPSPKWGDPHPEVFTDPAEIIRRESTPDITEQAMAAHIDALDKDGKLLEIDHRELSDARETTSRAEQYGEHLLNIAECAAKVVS
jgi:predicted ABC-type ATPase